MTKRIFIFLSALMLLVFITGCSPQIRRPVQIESKVNEIRRTYGVNIHYIYDAQEFFPEELLLAPISGKGSQISLKEAGRLLPIVEEFLSTYSKSLLKKNLSDIYLLGELKFVDKSYGGTYYSNSLYMTCRSQSEGYDKSYLLATMHRELSSILLRNYKHNFPTEAWEAANIAGWEYGGTGIEMLGQKDLFDQTDELLSKGFLIKYSQSSMENDFNEFSAWALTKTKRLQELASKYARINKKYQLIKNFYKKIEATDIQEL